MGPMNHASPVVLLRERDPEPARLITESLLLRDSAVTTLAEFHRWFEELAAHTYTRTERVALDELAGWQIEADTGDISHQSGKFFRVEGLDVRIPDAPVTRWDQPIINQPEVGVLGILVKEFDGVVHCLMQAKAEPGNRNGLQLSPTVQATRSNYTKVHRGAAVPYLEYFRDTARHQVMADVRQSEQGSWFAQKRNRNMVVKVTEEIELLDGFCWLSLGQVHQLLAVDDLVNMDTRTVLSCLPFSGAGVIDVPAVGGDGFRAALLRSCNAEQGSLHSTDDVLSWITEARTSTEVHTSPVPLNQLRQWRSLDGKICHERGLFFDVIGVSVRAAGREVGQWMQPMIEPKGIGLVAFLVGEIGGVLHALVHSRVEPGYVDVAELAPSVQCTPDLVEFLPAAVAPPFLNEVLMADPTRIRFDTTLSEEGGRFYHARTRYLIVEVDPDDGFDHPDYRWMALHQLADLLRHSHYLNVQARSLVACLHGLCGVSSDGAAQ
jgi:oxidase EvaA